MHLPEETVRTTKVLRSLYCEAVEASNYAKENQAEAIALADREPLVLFQNIEERLMMRDALNTERFSSS